jgi:hypothetical protein
MAAYQDRNTRRRCIMDNRKTFLAAAFATFAIAAKAAARNVFLLSIMHLLLVFLF